MYIYVGANESEPQMPHHWRIHIPPLPFLTHWCGQLAGLLSAGDDGQTLGSWHNEPICQKSAQLMLMHI